MRFARFSTIVMTVFLASAATQVFAVEKKEAPAKTETEKSDPASKAAPYLSPRFKALDTDHDGKITLEEFLKDQTADFNRRDADHDKVLSPDELDFAPGTPPEMKAMMRKQMQEQDLREQQMQAEMQKRREEDMKKMQAGQEKMRQDAEAERKTATSKTTTSPGTVTMPAAVKPKTQPQTTTTTTAKTPATSSAAEDSKSH